MLRLRAERRTTATGIAFTVAVTLPFAVANTDHGPASMGRGHSLSRLAV